MRDANQMLPLLSRTIFSTLVVSMPVLEAVCVLQVEPRKTNIPLKLVSLVENSASVDMMMPPDLSSMMDVTAFDVRGELAVV